MRGRSCRVVAVLLLTILSLANPVGSVARAAEKVVVDLDLGDDIDDAFALALVLASPEFEVLGISTAWGDTALRVRMVRRFLHDLGRDGIPVGRGIATTSTTVFSQARWAGRWPDDGLAVPSSLDLMSKVIAEHAGEVTLLAFGPLTNVAALLARDPERFARIGRIVMMGGSVRRGYGRSQYGPPTPPAREYNVVSDPAAARAVIASGVPIELFPLDSTRVQLDDVRRRELFAHGSATTDVLALLYSQWSAADAPWASAIPTLFDVVPVAAMIDPGLCPMQPMRIDVSDDGRTVETAGTPNVRVCLESDQQRVMDLMMRRLLRP